MADQQTYFGHCPFCGEMMGFGHIPGINCPTNLAKNPESDEITSLRSQLAELKTENERLTNERRVFRECDECGHSLDLIQFPNDCPCCDELAALARSRKLEEALNQISNPIEFLRAEAEAQGCKINGVMAVSLANDANYLREIARKAVNGRESMNLGAVLRKWRTMSELTTRDVEKIIGIDHATYNRIERGHPPSAESLRILLNWLLSGKEPK